MELSFDIFKRDGAGLVWVQAVQTLEAALTFARVQQGVLAEDYLIVNLRNNEERVVVLAEPNLALKSAVAPLL